MLFKSKVHPHTLISYSSEVLYRKETHNISRTEKKFIVNIMIYKKYLDFKHGVAYFEVILAELHFRRKLVKVFSIVYIHMYNGFQRKRKVLWH